MHGTLTGDGSGGWVELPEGSATVMVSGDFGSGTATLQVQTAEEAGEIDVEEGSWTDDACVNVQFGAGVRVRITLASSTEPDLLWEIHPIRARNPVGGRKGGLSLVGQERF